MKKVILLLSFIVSAALFGGYDLKIDGKFRNLNDNGLPENWYISDIDMVKTVPLKGEKYPALLIDSSNKNIFIRSRNAFPVDKKLFLKTEADFSGSGSGFIGVEVFNKYGKKIALKKLKTFVVTNNHKEVESKIKISEISPECAAIKIVIGINKNSVVKVWDIDSETDDD